MDNQSAKKPTPAPAPAPLLAARPRLDSRRHSDSAVGASSSSASHTNSSTGTARRDQPRIPMSPESEVEAESDTPGPHLATRASPSPPCPTPHSNDPGDAPASQATRTHAFYTRMPTNPSDLRTIHWHLAHDRLTCLDPAGAPVVEFALDELVWRADGMYGIEFGLDSRFVVGGEGDEMRVEETTSVSSSLGTIASDQGEFAAAGTASMSRELFAALQQEAQIQNNNSATGSAGTVVVHVGDQDGSVVESTDSFGAERNPRTGVMSRPGTAVDASRAVGARTATTDPETEAAADNAGYVEGFRIYSENAMEVTHWLNTLAVYRTSHPLIPRLTYTTSPAIDSYDSIAPPANTRRNSAAIGNPESLMATVATHLHHNAAPTAVRVTIVANAHADHTSLTPPGSVGSSASLAGTDAGSVTTAKFIRILGAAHGPVVVSTTTGGRVVVKDTATGKTVLDVRDSLEMLHDKMGQAQGGAAADSLLSSFGSLQNVETGNRIPLAGGAGRAAVLAGYKVPLKGDEGEHQMPEAAKDQGADVDGDDTLGNAQWKALKSGAEPVPAEQEPAEAPKIIIGHPEPSANDGEGDDEEALGDTLKGSGSAMRLKGAVVAAAEQTRQDGVGLSRLGM